MKKIIFVLIVIVVIACSSIYAVLYDPTTSHPYNDELPYNDLQIARLDVDGKPLVDHLERPLFKYHKYINEILKATVITIDKHGNKLVEGYGDGTFKPDGEITKAEFIKMAISMSNNRSFDYSIFPIPSRLGNHWAAPYIVVAEMQGVIEEGDINTYNMDTPINRLDMIKILSKIQINMKGIPQYRDGVMPNYTDITMLTNEEKELLLHAAKYDLIEGMFKAKEGDVLEIRPYDNVTRAEAVRALLRVY